MGMQPSKECATFDEGTSSSSLANIKYIEIEKPKWKVFRTKEIHALPVQCPGPRNQKTCHCGQEGTCKQKMSPCGVPMHYPQKSTARRRINIGNMKLDKPDTIKCQLPPCPRDSIWRPAKTTIKDVPLHDGQPQVTSLQNGETQLAVQVEQGRHSLTLLIDVTKVPDGKPPSKFTSWRVDNMECNGKALKMGGAGGTDDDERINFCPDVRK